MRTHGTSRLESVRPSAVEPSGSRLTDNHALETLETEWNQLVGFLRKKGSWLSLRLAVHRLLEIHKEQRVHDDPKSHVATFVERLIDEANVDRATIYRWRNHIEMLGACVGHETLRKLAEDGHPIANDSKALVKLAKLPKDKALLIIAAYLCNRKSAKRRLDRYIIADRKGQLHHADAGARTARNGDSADRAMPNDVMYGDVIVCARTILPGSVHCIVTSIPFYGLRDYGTRSWIGGKPEHRHHKIKVDRRNQTARCRCGAWYGQLGLEPTIGEYVAHMVDVFRALWVVLRDDGTIWFENDDCWAGSGRGPTGYNGRGNHTKRQGPLAPTRTAPGLPGKCMVLAPERLIVALQDDGWIVRSKPVWHKTTSTGEHVHDRCSHSYSMIYMLAKKPTYYWDYVAVMEDAVTHKPRSKGTPKVVDKVSSHDRRRFNPRYHDATNRYGVTKRYARDVWPMRSVQTTADHPAAWPEALAEFMIKASSSERGACAKCGTPWKPVLEEPEPVDDVLPAPKVLDWLPACKCRCKDVVPSIVLDPFAGSGTTLAAAMKLGRDYLGIELNETDYRPLIETCLADAKREIAREKHMAAGGVTRILRRTNSGKTEDRKAKTGRRASRRAGSPR